MQSLLLLKIVVQKRFLSFINKRLICKGKIQFSSFVD